MRAKIVLLAGLVVLLVLGVVLVLPGGDAPPGPVPSASASPAAPAELLVSVAEARGVLPGPVDVGEGYRIGDLRRNWKSNIKASGVPTCNEWGQDLGGELLEAYHWQQRKTRTYFQHPNPRGTIYTSGNSYYLAAIVFKSPSGALTAWDRLVTAVDACPRMYREPSGWGKPLTAKVNSPVTNDQRWLPGQVTYRDGWSRLRADERLTYKAIRGKDDTTWRSFSYAMRGNVIFAHQMSIWGRADDGTETATRARITMIDWLTSSRFEALASRSAPCRIDAGAMSCQTEDEKGR